VPWSVGRWQVSKLVACVAVVRKAADEIRITTFFKSFGTKKINERILTSNKLTNNFTGLVTSGLGPDVAGGPPVGPRWRNFWSYIRAHLELKASCQVLQLVSSHRIWEIRLCYWKQLTLELRISGAFSCVFNRPVSDEHYSATGCLRRAY
jgi:hypothetical protein